MPSPLAPPHLSAPGGQVPDDLFAALSQLSDGEEWSRNYCENRPGYYGLSDDGGLAPYLLARRRDLVPIGDLDPIQAAPLGDAGGTAYGAVNAVLPYIRPNGFVVVVGVGGLGSFALQLLRLTTPATVIAVDLAERPPPRQ